MFYAVASPGNDPSGSDDLARYRVLTSLGYALLGDLLILCTSDAPPSDEDWNEWIARSTKIDYRALLIFSAGGSPNPKQRRRLSDAVDKLPGPRQPVALLTDSLLVRSIATAFSWLLGGKQPLRVVPTEALAEALAWQGIALNAAVVQEMIDRLQSDLTRARATRK